MPNFSARYIILYIIIALTIIYFYLIFSQSLYSLIPTSCLKSIYQYRSLTSKTSTSDDKELPLISNESPLVRLYLDIVRDTVCGLTLRTQESSVVPGINVIKHPFDITLRTAGEDWPLIGISMIGQSRLINIEWALRFVIANDVSGDFIECGVWRGGGSVFARAVLKALNIEDRHVWLVDSFEGLPKPRTANDHEEWSKYTYLRVLIYFLNKMKDHLFD
jgi:hypothetical protein